jgi:hypothetical protein
MMVELQQRPLKHLKVPYATLYKVRFRNSLDRGRGAVFNGFGGSTWLLLNRTLVGG